MAGNLGGLVKRLQDIMRQDAGINGDAQRIEQIVWMLFLKVYSAKEEEWEFADKAYISIIPEDYRWQNWAVDDGKGTALTGEKLLNFVNDLFRTLKELAPQVKNTIDWQLFSHSIHGVEKKQFPYMLAVTNMLLHDIDEPDILHGNSLTRKVLDYTDEDKFDITALRGYNNSS